MENVILFRGCRVSIPPVGLGLFLNPEGEFMGHSGRDSVVKDIFGGS